MLTLFTITLAIALAAFALLWLASLKLSDASIVDLYWGPGFAVLALAGLVMAAEATARGVLLAALAMLWGGRLAVHLGRRWWREGREDPRYAAMRARRKQGFALWSLPCVFLAQALVQWFVAFPLLAGGLEGGTLGLLDGIGAAIALAGLAIEARADAELERFRADPAAAGKVLDRGLWALSRHPNYFGDTVFWWGIFVIAAAGGAAWTVLSPLVMTGLILKVSGVPLLERGLTERRAGYAAYAARTSAFVPWPPRRPKEDQRR